MGGEGDGERLKDCMAVISKTSPHQGPQRHCIM